MINETLGRFLPDLWYSPSDALLRASEVFIWKNLKFSHPVLDIGCGDGRMSVRLFNPAQKIDMGIDLNPSGLDQAKKTGIYKQVLRADATKLPFKPASFQTVISHSTFEHIPKDTQAISEVARVLKPGGRFYLTVPTPRLRPFLSDQINTRVAHFHYRSAEDWEKIFSKHGLTLVSNQNYFPPKSVKTWVKLFKLATTRIYHRELWSYLRDSPYGKLLPANLISGLLKIYLSKYVSTGFSSDGTWQFLIAQKS